MLRFSANLSFLYGEFPFLDRFAAAAADGFGAVEYLGPYDFSKERVAQALAGAGIEQALFNVPSGNWDGGERGIACLPDRVDEFRAGIPKALDYAEALGCRQLNVLAGIAPEGADPQSLETTFVDNLRFAAALCAQRGIRLLIEPINTRDIPGFYLSRLAHAERVLEAVGSENLFIQFDFYHVQVMEGNLVENFARLRDRIAHVQVADNPGRNAPGTGEINYDFVFAQLDRLGYEGWIGCEYRPGGATSASLGWMAGYQRAYEEQN